MSYSLIIKLLVNMTYHIQKRLYFMENAELIGKLILVAVPVMVSLIALIKPIINLNVNIQKLSDAISKLNSDNTAIKNTVDEHEDKINDHETRISIIESRDQ